MPGPTSLLTPAAVGAPLSILLAFWGCGGSSSTTPGASSVDGGLSSGGNGSSGSSGVGGSSGTSGGGTGSSSGAGGGGAGAPSTCIVGSQGCLCDSAGGCAPSLTCTPQTASEPSLCCSGSNCAPSGGSIGASCSSVTSAASCPPGITIPAAAGGNDSCGYPASSFVESTTLCALNAVGGGAKPAVIQVFYNDEHALTLGCATPTDPVSALPSNPATVRYPPPGAPACVDAVARPLRPVLYVTDLTADPTCTAGDQQRGGHPYDPIAVFGTWKAATEGAGNVGMPAMADPMPGNKWNLGSSADAVPAAAMACHEGYGAELQFEVGLVSGHSYRFQVIVHDGDQNKGGDSGEACAVFCAGTGSSCAEGVTACKDVTQCAEGEDCTQGCCVPPSDTPPEATDASSSTPR